MKNSRPFRWRSANPARSNASHSTQLPTRVTSTHHSPVVVKLDVEGVEIGTLKGACELLQCDCLVICEEHGSGRTHGVSRHLITEMAFKLYAYDADSGRFVELQSIGALDRIKKHAWVGYSVFATASPFWTDRLGSETWKVR